MPKLKIKNKINKTLQCTTEVAAAASKTERTVHIVRYWSDATAATVTTIAAVVS